MDPIRFIVPPRVGESINYHTVFFLFCQYESESIALTIHCAAGRRFAFDKGKIERFVRSFRHFWRKVFFLPSNDSHSEAKVLYFYYEKRGAARV